MLWLLPAPVYSTKLASGARNAAGPQEIPAITGTYRKERANTARGARFEWPFRSRCSRGACTCTPRGLAARVLLQLESPSAQYGETREIRLHGRIMTGAAGVPAAAGF